MVVTQCRTCSTNIKEALTVHCSGRSGGPGDLDSPLPKVPRPQKFPPWSVCCRCIASNCVM